MARPSRLGPVCTCMAGILHEAAIFEAYEPLVLDELLKDALNPLLGYAQVRRDRTLRQRAYPGIRQELQNLSLAPVVVVLMQCGRLLAGAARCRPSAAVAGGSAALRL